MIESTLLPSFALVFVCLFPNEKTDETTNDGTRWASNRRAQYGTT